MRSSNLLLVVCKAVALLIVSAVIFVAIFALAATATVQPDTTFFYRDYRDFLSDRGDADVLVIGNSKALSSLSSSVLSTQLHKKTYNMAYRAANLKFTRDLLVAYLNTCRHKPALCILEVSWLSFSKLGTSYPVDKLSLDWKICELRQLARIMIAARSTVIRQAVGSIVREPQRNYIDWWDGDPKNAPPTFDQAQFNLQDLKRMYPRLEAGVDDELLRSYREIISVCKENDIKLFLYTAPEAPIYTSWQKDKVLVKNIIARSAEENDLEYFDFTVDGPYYRKELDRMLYNSNHVRRAADFTKYFLKVLANKNILP